MEFEEEGGGFNGSVPEFGAIFMSNIATKRESFKKKVLGLPLSRANFVKQIKCGMILFLFEFEKRELYGVYRATSDGGLNLVPHAFHGQYPAQVCFTPIWDCSPLSEPEFRDAIRDNYYTPKKFNFGLSRNQVRDLLMLFSPRKLINKLPTRQFPGVINDRVGEDNMADDDSSAVTNGSCNESCIFPPVIAHPNNSWDREIEINGDAYSKGGRFQDEYRVSCPEGGYLSNDYSDSRGRRRKGEEGRMLMNDVAGYGLNDHPLSKGSRLDQGSFPSVMPSNESADPVHVSTKNAKRTNRERIVDQPNIECSHGMIRMAESFGKLSNDRTSTHRAVFGRSPRSEDFEEHHSLNYAPPASGKFVSDHENNMRKVNSQHRYFLDSAENNNLKDYVANSTFPSTRFVSPSRDIDKIYGDARSPVGLNRRKHSHDIYGGSDYRGSRKEYIQSLGRVQENAMEFDSSDYHLEVAQQLANADRYRRNNPENVNSRAKHRDLHHHLIGGDPYTEMKQISAGSGSMPFLNETLPQITDAMKFDTSFSRFQEATITRALPCDQELATSHCQHSSSSQVYYGSGLAKNNFYSVEHGLDAFPNNRSMPYCGNVPEFNADQRKRSRLNLQTRIDDFHSDNEFYENLELSSTSSKGYRAPPSTVPYMDEAALQGDYAGLAPLALDSSSHPSFAADSPFSSSLGIKEHVALQESDEMLYYNNKYDIYEPIVVDPSSGNMLSELSHSDYEKLNRRSVFSRLSSKKLSLRAKETSHVPGRDEHFTDTSLSSKKLSLRGKETSHVPGYDEHFTDTSVDEVMGMLQDQFFDSKTQMKCRSLVRRCDNGEIDTHETNHNPLMISSQKMHNWNVQQPIELNAHSAPEETRAVEFKRRSETKKSLRDSVTIDDPISLERVSSEGSVVKPIEQNAHSAPEETRAVEFKRRSETKKSLRDSITKDDPISVERVSSEGSVVKEPQKRRKVPTDLISEEGKKPSESDTVKEPVNKLPKRRKLVRPVFGKSDIVDQENHQNSNVLVSSNYNAKSQNTGSIKEPLSSGQQSLGCVLKNGSDPRDSLSSDLDSTITVQEQKVPNSNQISDSGETLNSIKDAKSQHTGSIKELLSSAQQSLGCVLKNSSDPRDSSISILDSSITVQEQKVPNSNQISDSGETLDLVKDANFKSVGKPSQTVVTVEADSEISPEETPKRKCAENAVGNSA